jgi:DNA invertase Pin-like site-specific DNA recombinase
LTWEFSRLTRSEDPRDAAEIEYVLQKYNCLVITLSKGPVDLSDTMGGLLYDIEKRLSVKERKYTAARAIRGKREELRQGIPANGSLPYVYHYAQGNGEWSHDK